MVAHMLGCLVEHRGGPFDPPMFTIHPPYVCYTRLKVRFRLKFFYENLGTAWKKIFKNPVKISARSDYPKPIFWCCFWPETVKIGILTKIRFFLCKLMFCKIFFCKKIVCKKFSKIFLCKQFFYKNFFVQHIFC